LATLRRGGAAPIACVIDPVSHIGASLAAADEKGLEASEREPLEQDLRALLHLLAEHDVRAYVVRSGIPIGEQLVGARGGASGVPA